MVDTKRLTHCNNVGTLTSNGLSNKKPNKFSPEISKCEKIDLEMIDGSTVINIQDIEAKTEACIFCL